MEIPCVGTDSNTWYLYFNSEGLLVGFDYPAGGIDDFNSNGITRSFNELKEMGGGGFRKKFCSGKLVEFARHPDTLSTTPCSSPPVGTTLQVVLEIDGADVYAFDYSGGLLQSMVAQPPKVGPQGQDAAIQPRRIPVPGFPLDFEFTPAGVLTGIFMAGARICGHPQGLIMHGSKPPVPAFPGAVCANGTQYRGLVQLLFGCRRFTDVVHRDERLPGRLTACRVLTATGSEYTVNTERGCTVDILDPSGARLFRFVDGLSD